MLTSRTTRGLVAALALASLTSGCSDGVGTAGAPAPAPTATPSLGVAVTPRPPGPPTYHPLPRFNGPDPVDVRFAMTVSPYHGLRTGSRFNVVLTYTNNERRPVRISPNMQFGDAMILKVVDAAGGKVSRMDNHDPATNGKYPFFVRGVDFENYRLKPGKTNLRVVLQLLDVMCPGGGDFITEISGGVGRIIRRGSNGGRHLVWVDNDAADYARQRASQGTTNTSPPHSVCRAQSVE